jgi:hypothetical protein
VDERLQDGFSRPFLKVRTWLAEPDSLAEHAADPETMSDQLV